MYKIIGADQKEYGPVSSEQIRQWIIEGRLNSQSQAKSEAGGDWQPLASFDDFVDLLRPQAPPPGPAPAYTPGAAAAPAPMPGAIPSASREAALQAVKTPAICMIVTASVGIVIYLLTASVHFMGVNTMSHRQMPPDMPPWIQHAIESNQGPHGGFIALFAVAINAFILLGAIRMLRLESRSMAIAACIVAMLPCSCCCLLGIPFGIWGLVVLNKPEVKSAF